MTKQDEISRLHRMHIMMMSSSYPPIIDSCARLYSELSESLRERGHRVTVISEHPAKTSSVDKNHEYFSSRNSGTALRGEVVLRVSPLAFMAKIPGCKPLRFFLSCFLFALRGIFADRPDVILVYSPPLFMGISGYIISKVRRARFVLNVQDIHPKVLIDSGIITNPLFKSILFRIEEVCYKKAHSLIVYSDGNRDYVVQKGAKGHVYIIPNWADNHAAVSYNKAHSLRNEDLIGNRFVVSYAGSMQQAQGLDVVVETAEVLKENKNIVFLLAGEGTSKPVLEDLINEKHLNNVQLRPVMSSERYKQFLNESDVCLVTLSLDIPPQTVPGKLADIMGCGKPLILAANLQGDAAQLIHKARCGFCVDPQDAGSFSRAVLNLYGDEKLRSEMGENGRLFAEQHFSRAVCTKQYEEVLFSAIIQNHDPS